METLIPAVVLAVLGVAMTVSSVDRRSKTIDRRLQRLEHKVDLLLEHLGAAEPEDPAFKEIDALAREGKMIQAIKLHRETTGSGLAEAKEAVERRMR
ncbi:hypothetical protein [Streptomyces chattanoogensis]|uniref:Ribosomal protein L7/L12 C-terminal domain-containing protein n=1 Tax=Streptomyces chattanoogensis TaxID=66876 RepID=A0A0N0H269_9ACTN|nr:hypothetical protein [Streptomyces chattanoogensis]KPC64850.1 hypothetical protein ADL29_09470 [Streptomyces chattanoogensis]